MKDYENMNLVNLPLYKAAQLPLILCMISKNSDFGVGGNVNFFYRSEFYTHEHKIHQSEPENYPLTICIKSSWYMERFLKYNQICDEKLPLVKIRKNKPKRGNFLISASNYQRYTKFTSRYMFWWMTNTMKLVKISLRTTKSVKI